MSTPPLQGPPLDRDAVYRRIFWRLMPLLIACYFIANIDRTNVAYAKLQFLDSLGFTETVYGIGAGIFSLGYIMFEIPSNMMLKRVGIRQTLLRIMLLWGMFCIALSLMADAWHFYTLRFLLGAAEAGFFPGVMYFLYKWVPADKRAGAMAILMTATGLSGVLAGPIAGVVITGLNGFMGLEGWQWLFIMEGVPAVLFGITAYFYLNETPGDAKWLTPEERQFVVDDVGRGSQPSVEASGKTSSYLNREFIGVLCACLALMGGTTAFMMWMPTIMRGFGIESIMLIGFYSSGPFAVAVICQLANARHSDRHGERTLHIVIPLSIAACGWLALAFGDFSPLQAIVALTVIAAGTMAAFGPFWAMPPSILPAEKRAVGIALVTTIGGTASFVQPIVFGAAIDRFGLGYAQMGNGIFIAVFIILFLAISPRRPSGAKQAA
ncbi:hypothetical protein IP81_06700 [Novosphingobium sp. AAP83]|uniref:MFS transporter n=1 Tax=Novosphingobium sp. AAP83 TaxID=1523425 RepID=UPI0006CE211F|nr:MFS transporter [Novosphingobium sp. AAP83]KPF92401.1 hypothetical protein IP81_06700 [Novosphingobium sp. AAP83]